MRERIGYFSDVHSNLWAMEAMRAVIKERQNGWKWYFGGDVVGWLYQPIECVEVLMSMIADGLIKGAVAGNHDLLAINGFADRPDQIARRIATAYSAGALSVESKAKEFLANLPLLEYLPEEDGVVVHHSPFCLPQFGQGPTIDNFSYLSQDFEPQLGVWAQCKWPVILSGHDHISAVHRIRAGLIQPTLDDVATFFPGREELAISIESGYRYWAQSGSAGGPFRDGMVELNWIEFAPGEQIILHRAPFETKGLKRSVERQPYGSLLDWQQFTAKAKPAQGRGARN